MSVLLVFGVIWLGAQVELRLGSIELVAVGRRLVAAQRAALAVALAADGRRGRRR